MNVYGTQKNKYLFLFVTDSKLDLLKDLNH